MDNREVAKALTLQLIQSMSLNALFTADITGDPEAIGKTIALLYKSILNGIND